MRKVAILAYLSAVVVLFCHCSEVKMIPGTSIPDTGKNREIVKVLEKYRRAMMQRDSGTLMAMAHPHYYEHSGTPKGGDDYGHKGLIRVIKQRMAQLQAVRYNIKYRKINWVNPKQVEVEIYIDASFQIEAPKGENKWHRKTDYNKLVLTKKDGRWLILRGM